MHSKHKPANVIQDLQFFGEFGGVNPSISDSSTYTFLAAKSMMDTFEGNTEGCYLYSRHSSPSNLNLAQAISLMEGTESANVTASIARRQRLQEISSLWVSVPSRTSFSMINSSRWRCCHLGKT